MSASPLKFRQIQRLAAGQGWGRSVDDHVSGEQGCVDRREIVMSRPGHPAVLRREQFARFEGAGVHRDRACGVQTVAKRVQRSFSSASIL